MEIKELYENKNSIWLGMSDYRLILKLSEKEIVIRYIGEPPHGDSYHHVEVNGKLLRGYFWGCMFLFPSKQRYLVASWMESLYDRKTIIVDLEQNRYTLLGKYWYDYKEVDEKVILGNTNFEENLVVDLSTTINWLDI